MIARRAASPRTGSGRPRTGNPPSARPVNTTVEKLRPRSSSGVSTATPSLPTLPSCTLPPSRIARSVSNVGQVDALPEHGECQQTAGCVAYSGGGLLGEHAPRELLDRGRPIRPRGALRKPGCGTRELPHRSLEGAWRAAAGAFSRDARRHPRRRRQRRPRRLPSRITLRSRLRRRRSGRSTRRPPRRRRLLVPRPATTPSPPVTTIPPEWSRRQEIGDRPPGERFAGERRQTISKPRQQSRSVGPLRPPARDREAGARERGRHELYIGAVRHHDGAVPQGRPLLGGGHDRPHGLSALGPLVGDRDDLEGAVAGEHRRVAARHQTGASRSLSACAPGAPMLVRARPTARAAATALARSGATPRGNGTNASAPEARSAVKSTSWATLRS